MCVSIPVDSINRRKIDCLNQGVYLLSRFINGALSLAALLSESAVEKDRRQIFSVFRIDSFGPKASFETLAGFVLAIIHCASSTDESKARSAE
jgi:hypothetical protein